MTSETVAEVGSKRPRDEEISLATGKCNYRLLHTLRGHTAGVASVKFSPKGDLLATASADSTVQLWRWEDGSHVHTFEGHQAGINDVAWSADAQFLASASDDMTIRLWDVAGQKAVNTFAGHTNYVMCLNFNHKGNMLASGSFDETVKLWEVKSGHCINTLPAHSDPVTAVHFNKDSTLVVSSSYDGLCRVWNSSNGMCLRTIIRDDNPPVSFVRFSPNGLYILVCTLDNNIRLWKYDKNECAKTYTGHTNKQYCSFAAFCKSKDTDTVKHQYVVSGSEDCGVYIWDIDKKHIAQVLEGRQSSSSKGDGHCDAVVAIDCHPHKQVLASGALKKDCTVKIWIDDGSTSTTEGS